MYQGFKKATQCRLLKPLVYLSAVVELCKCVAIVDSAMASKRKFCEHCGESVSSRTYRLHAELYPEGTWDAEISSEEETFIDDRAEDSSHLTEAGSNVHVDTGNQGSKGNEESLSGKRVFDDLQIIVMWLFEFRVCFVYYWHYLTSSIQVLTLTISLLTVQN